MRLVVILVFACFFGLAAWISPVPTKENPCVDFRRDLSPAWTKSNEPVTLLLPMKDSETELELKLPANFASMYGNLRSGYQCGIWLEATWPALAPGGLFAAKEKHIRDRMIGDVLVYRRLSISIHVDNKPAMRWHVPHGYCIDRLKWPNFSGDSKVVEIADKPYGLRAFDDGRAWPQHRQADGSYRNMRELVSFPHNKANKFYFVDGSADERVSIVCVKGGPSCTLHDRFLGFATSTTFDFYDLENWRVYRDSVRKFLGARAAVHNLKPESPMAQLWSEPVYQQCAREMNAIAAAHGEQPLLREK